MYIFSERPARQLEFPWEQPIEVLGKSPLRDGHSTSGLVKQFEEDAPSELIRYRLFLCNVPQVQARRSNAAVGFRFITQRRGVKPDAIYP